jgi:glycolate oxidase
MGIRLTGAAGRGRLAGELNDTVEASQRFIQPLLEHFAAMLGAENVIDPRTQPERAENYLKDMADYSSEPLLVLQPSTLEHVSSIVSFARKEKIPVVARGAGTSLTGASSAHGGLVVDFSKNMNKVLRIDTVNWYVHCQAGVVLDELNVELKKKGFFFPPDPSSAPWATVGGVVAENSGGMKCFRYGTVKDWVYALRVVLSSGEVVKLGEPLPKNRSGYDLVHLVCGSEGTLALVAEAWLKIIPLPSSGGDPRPTKRMLVFFDSLEAIGRSIIAMREARLQPILLEFMDRDTIHWVNEAFPELKLPPEHEATLLIEAENRTVDEVVKVCEKNGSSGCYVARDVEDDERLYNARTLVYLGIRAIGLAFHTEDVVVPLDRLSEYLLLLREVSKRYGVRIPVGGHAGDGNVHPIILYDAGSEDSRKTAKLAFAEICRYAIEVGGSVTGEHGVGEQKIEYAADQLRAHSGEAAIELMRKVKRVWDPENILNPNKFLAMNGGRET